MPTQPKQKGYMCPRCLFPACACGAPRPPWTQNRVTVKPIWQCDACNNIIYCCTCKYNSGHLTCCVAAEMPRAGARIAHADTCVFRLIMFVASCSYAGDSCTCVEVDSRNKYTLMMTATSMISAAIVIMK